MEPSKNAPPRTVKQSHGEAVGKQGDARIQVGTAGAQTPHGARLCGPIDGGGGGAVRRVDLVGGGQAVVLFDLETTGLSPKNDRVIQIGAKVMGSEKPSHVFSAYVDPEGKLLSRRIQDLTGITPKILKANKALRFRQVWPQFARWLELVGAECSGGRGVILAAHNAKFDRGFLLEELARAGIGRFVLAELGVVSFLDTLGVLKDKRMWRQSETDLGSPARPKAFNLGGLFKHLNGHEIPDMHTALGDVIGLESVLSAPGIRERWWTVANTNPGYQTAVARSELQPDKASGGAPVFRLKRPLPNEEGARQGMDREERSKEQLAQSALRVKQGLREKQAKEKALEAETSCSSLL